MAANMVRKCVHTLRLQLNIHFYVPKYTLCVIYIGTCIFETISIEIVCTMAWNVDTIDDMTLVLH